MGELRGLDAWLHCLAEQELPTLNAVVQEICEVSQNERSRAEDLTKIILRDANLTSRVLKIANSIHYNTSFESIKTVSRAIVQLGFENVKTITLASSLIETFLKGKPQELIIQTMARAFHAAVQAKAMVMHMDFDSREQVFIAALLSNIAELALLSTGKKVTADFVIARNKNPEQERQLAQKYLGVDLPLLNQHLIKDWLLGDIINDVCGPVISNSVCAKAVLLGNELSKHIHKGLAHPEVKRLCQRIADLGNINLEAAKKQIVLKADEASVVAKNYGAESLLVAMPDPEVIQADLEADENDEANSEYLFQQQVNQLHRMMLDNESMSVVTQQALMALNQGSQIPRIAVLVVDHKTRMLDARYVAGKGTHSWRREVKIPLHNLHKEEILCEFFRLQQPLRYQPASEKHIGNLRSFAVSGDIFLAPLHYNKRLLAILYADGIDKNMSSRQFEEFQLIANQLNLMMRLNAGMV
jgi:hypothetical protein